MFTSHRKYHANKIKKFNKNKSNFNYKVKFKIKFNIFKVSA